MCCSTFCQLFVFRGCFLLAKGSQCAAPKASGREVSNFTNQNKFPAGDLLQSLLKPEGFFQLPGRPWCRLVATLLVWGWSSGGFMAWGSCLQEDQGRVICLEMSSPPCPVSALQQEVIPIGSLHKTSTHCPSFGQKEHLGSAPRGPTAPALQSSSVTDRDGQGLILEAPKSHGTHCITF